MLTSDHLLASWRGNTEINDRLLARIAPHALASTMSTRGGRDVAGQFAHMHSARVAWLQYGDRGLAGGLKRYRAKDRPSIGELRRALRSSSEAVGRWMAGASTTEHR